MRSRFREQNRPIEFSIRSLLIKFAYLRTKKPENNSIENLARSSVLILSTNNYFSLKFSQSPCPLVSPSTTTFNCSYEPDINYRFTPFTLLNNYAQS